MFTMSGSEMFKKFKMDNIRSPFDNIFNIISGLPQGHEKPLKHALYNALALFLLCLCCAAGWALYLILEPFIKPLMWALLIGSVLHPIKYSLATNFRSWFDQLEISTTPVMVGIVMLPLNVINDSAEFIGSKLLKHIKLIVCVSVIVPAMHLLYNYTPGFFISFTLCFVHLICATLTFLINYNTFPVVFTLFLLYISAVIIYWRPEFSQQFQYAALGAWLIISCFISHYAGLYKVHAFILLQLLFLAGFIVEIFEIKSKLTASGGSISFIESIKIAFSPAQLKDEVDANVTQEVDKEIKEIKQPSVEQPKLESGDETITKNDGPLEETQTVHKRPCTVPTATNRRHTITTLPGCRRTFIESQILSRLSKSNSELEENNSFTSDFYLYGVIWACGLMLFWKHAFLLTILPIPMLIYITKHVGIYFGLWNYAQTNFLSFFSNMKLWCVPRMDALLPLHIRGIYKIMYKTNKKIEQSLVGSIDSVASVVVILGLIIFLACASVFICFQIYAEAIMLIQIGSNVVNSTVVHNPELRQLLPPGWDDTIESLLDNAYTYGREGISKAMRGIMRDVEDAKAAKLEQQVLELWDRVYQSWVSSLGDDTSGPQVTNLAVQHSWNNFLADVQTSTDIFNLNGLMEFIKQNIGTLMSLLESIWSILKGNINLVLGSLSAFLSVLLGGGTAVLNFILNMVVFLTTLFYLLSSSGTLYKPVEIMTSVSPSNGSRFGLALEQAINGVFKATGKMALFYGLWTWFIHNLFNVKIVYLPSALATILAALPFLGSYWACLPAVLDLWLAQDHLLLACLFALCQFAPCTFVDTTIYQEIKGGGHPYLTGLAIAGGIFWLGVEGAIIGPLLLCGLFVAMDLSSTLFRETPSEESALPIRLHRMDSVL